ncbi:MAG: NAD(P)/FAD-dependent oxidoreductase, partial [Spongiibacteraceae bacterium]
SAATVWIDLAPDRTSDRIAAALARPRGSRSLAKHLHGAVGIDGLKAALLRDVLSAEQMHDMQYLAAAIKALPLRVTATRPLDEAISSAGGTVFDALDPHLMLHALPGYFCAGEMLDWEAPTGGYLLTACLATGHRAGRGVLQWLHDRKIEGQQK